jgi:hypothetical protein
MTEASGTSMTYTALTSPTTTAAVTTATAATTAPSAFTVICYDLS